MKRQASLNASLPLIGVIILAAHMRIPNLGFDLPEIYGEAAPMRQAWEMWGRDTGRIDLDPRFHQYPALTFYVHFASQVVYNELGILSNRFVRWRDHARRPRE